MKTKSALEMENGEIGLIVGEKPPVCWTGTILLCQRYPDPHQDVWVMLNLQDWGDLNYYFDKGGLTSNNIQVLILGNVSDVFLSIKELREKYDLLDSTSV